MIERFKAAWRELVKVQPIGEQKDFDVLGTRSVVWYGGSPFFLDSNKTKLDNNTIVQACLGWITRNFPEPPSCIETLNTTGKIEKNFDHPLIELLNRPDQGKMTSRRLWKATIGSRFLDGNAYWEIVDDRTGTPRELVHIPFNTITPMPVKGLGTLDHYEIKLLNGTVRTLDPDEVVHFADGIDDMNPLKGVSTLKSAMRLVMTDNEATAYSERVLRNLDSIGLMVSPVGDNTITEAEANLLRARIRQGNGKEAQGSTHIAGKEVKVEHLGIDPSKMMVRDLQRVPEERISAVFGVAAIVVGLGAGLDRSTFANMAEAREAATEQLLIPLWSETDDDLTIQLGSRFRLNPNEYVARDLSKVAILQEDENKRWDRLGKAYQTQGITRAEYREGIGFDVDQARDGGFYQDPVATAQDPKKQLEKEILEHSRERRRLFDSISDGD